MSSKEMMFSGARLWLRAAAGGTCTGSYGAVASCLDAQSSCFTFSTAPRFHASASSLSHAKPAVPSSSGQRPASDAQPKQFSRHSSPRRRRDTDRQRREPSAAGGGDTFIRRGPSSPAARVAAYPSAPVTPAGQPLLRHAPGAGSAPLPSSTSCPSLAALNDHVQRYGHLYKLSHIAAGLQVLAQLVPAAAPRHGPAPSAPHQAGSADSPTCSSERASVNTSTAIGSAQDAAAQQAAAQPSSAEVARQARQVAELLVLAGQHQLRQEDDLASISACIGALARTGLHEEPAAPNSRPVGAEAQASSTAGRAQPQLQSQPLRALAAVQLAMPFVERLRAPTYYYHMRSQPAEVLAQLLHALGKLRPWAYLPQTERHTFAMVVGRVVSSLHTVLPELGLQEAVAAAQAMARLHLPVRGHDRNTAFLQALARRLVSDILPSSSPSPEDAFRLVWAYSELLPGACGMDDSAYAAAPSPAEAPSAPAAEAATGLPGAEAGAGAKPAAKQGGHQPARSGGGDADVAALVAACCRVVRKSLGSPEPQSPRLLARLIRALGRLQAQCELQALVPQAAPVLLAHLPSLDTGNLVDVTFACAANGVAERGLSTAIADQIAASEGPLTMLEAQRLLTVYGARGAAPHAGLRQRVRLAVAQSLDARVHDLHGLLRVLDDQDEIEAALATLVRERLKTSFG